MATGDPVFNSLRRATVAYLLAEAALILAFWVVVLTNAGVAGLFSGGRGAPAGLRMFVLGDLAVIVVPALLAAWMLSRGRTDRAAQWLIVHAGAMSYAGASTLGGWWLEMFSGFALSLMAPAVAASVWLANAWWRERP